MKKHRCVICGREMSEEVPPTAFNQLIIFCEDCGPFGNYRISDFYETKTGRSAVQGPGRIRKIEGFLFENELTLDEIKIEKHNDYLWNTRRNRTELEKRAEIIGSTNDAFAGYLKEMWWIIPLK